MVKNAKQKNTRRKKKAPVKLKKRREFIFTFSKPRVGCTLEFMDLDDSQRKELLDALEIVSDNIYIDKSYVDYAGTKYEKTFMSEEGWNSLCQLLEETNLGKRATKKEKKILNDAYMLMIQCYIEQQFQDAGYDIEGMSFKVQPSDQFKVKIEEDRIREWERYPGKWQTWPENNI